MMRTQFSRRALMGAMATIPLACAAVRTSAAQGEASLVDSIVIDLPSTPESIDPALAYSPRDWSIVHSIYDALVQFDENGELVPLAAESFTTADAITFSVKLREGLEFHDGSPVTADAIKRSVAYMQESGSSAADLFTVIDRVDVLDDLSANIVCSAPSPWLPAQLAAWIVLIPEGMTADTAATAPIGSGPYIFESYAASDQLELTRNEKYTWDSPKGTPLAARVTYRFVPEATTRIANIASGEASLITEIPVDQWDAVTSSGATLLSDPIVGIAFVRIASDAAPFSDVRVRQAVNYAVDVQEIASALVGDGANRLASIFPDKRSLGFDPAVEPYPYDVDKAKQLLTEAGYEGGFRTQLEMTSTARLDIAEAISQQLADVGISVELVSSDYPTFNAGWTDPARPALRMVTWSPLYDPQSLLSLAFVTDGYLSRYSNPDVDAAFALASIEADPEQRAGYLRQVNAALHDDPACIYLWNLLASYGVSDEVSSWKPRGDEYVIATASAGEEG
jgi:peptide/nickel transport system substrate-binding protein